MYTLEAEASDRYGDFMLLQSSGDQRQLLFFMSLLRFSWLRMLGRPSCTSPEDQPNLEPGNTK